MLEFFKFALSDFWVFVGTAILLYGAAYFIVNMILRIWIRFMRYLSVKSKGWPPPHLDADGDWNTEQKEAND